jgi:3-phenylpropionate/trans-cinnamate dioxygenase ferredoxin reductase subunit
MEAVETAVAAVRRAGPDTVAIDVETPPGFAARPGQFVKVSGAPDADLSRFYTISSPDTEGTFEVTVEIDPEGELGPWLSDLEAGDALTVEGPYGNVHYDGEARSLVLAGGPGVGPAVGIAERALAVDSEVGVVYRDADPVHADRLAAAADAGAFVAIVDDDDALTEAVRDGLAAVGDDAQVFVYGFADFLDAATDALAAAGVDPDAALMENFG